MNENIFKTSVFSFLYLNLHTVKVEKILHSDSKPYISNIMTTLSANPLLKHFSKSALQLPAFLFGLLFIFTQTACDMGSGSGGSESEGSKAIQIKIQDIRSKTIVYDIYQVSNDELEYVGTEVADRDGSTVINVEVGQSVNNIIIKRTKDGVEKRQVVPLKSDKVEVQFLL